MNNITTTTQQLPDTLEDLSRFVLIGREKLNSVRAEIRAINKIGLAKEVHEQKLAEAQEIAEAVLDAEVKIGELTKRMEKAQGERRDLELSNNSVTKLEQLDAIGISKLQASRFEQLANNPECVEQAKTEARENNRIVTRQNVLDKIAPVKSRTQSMKEFKQKARDEHEEFRKTSSTQNVIDLSAAREDKANQEVIGLDVSVSIRKVFSAVNSISFLKTDEMKIMLDETKTEEKRELINQAQNCIRILTHLIRVIEEG